MHASSLSICLLVQAQRKSHQEQKNQHYSSRTGSLRLAYFQQILSPFSSSSCAYLWNVSNPNPEGRLADGALRRMGLRSEMVLVCSRPNCEVELDLLEMLGYNTEEREPIEGCVKALLPLMKATKGRKNLTDTVSSY